jgi:N-carbamoylputrescine amidase
MSADTNFRIGLVQMSCSPDPSANLDKAADRVRDAAREGADVVCLPELFTAQYFGKTSRYSISRSRSPAPAPSG